MKPFFEYLGYIFIATMAFLGSYVAANALIIFVLVLAGQEEFLSESLTIFAYSVLVLCVVGILTVGYKVYKEVDYHDE